MAPKDLFQQLFEITEEEQISMSDYIRKAVEEKIENELDFFGKDNQMFSSYYGSNWRESYPSEMEINSLLKQVNINHELVRIDSKTLIDGSNDELQLERIALKITTREIGEDSECSVYIDVINDLPIGEQFMDATYGPGANADLRIIVCGPVPEHDFVADMVRISNKCGFATDLVTASHIGPLIYYEPIESKGSPDRDISELPSKRQALLLDFWANHFTPDQCYYEINNINYKRASYVIIKDYGEYEVEWNDEGLFIIYRNEHRPELVNHFWNNREKYTHFASIGRWYPDFRINLIERDNKPYGINLLIDDTPVSVLENMTRTQKEDYAVVSDALELFYRTLNKLLEDYELKNDGLKCETNLEEQ